MKISITPFLSAQCRCQFGPVPKGDGPQNLAFKLGQLVVELQT